MGGIVFEAPFTQGPGHHVEVVKVIAIGGGAGVVALGHQDHITISRGHGFIERPIFRVDPLHCEALSGVEAVIIGFLKIGHIRIGVFIVPVAGVAGPIACGREDLCDEQTVGHVAIFHCYIIYKTGVLAFAAWGEGDARRAKPLRAVAPFARRGADGQGAFCGGCGLPVLIIGHIEAMGG